MLLLENIGECVFCIGDKNLIPGTEPVEVTKEEAEHPTVKLYIKAKKLSLREVTDEVFEPVTTEETGTTSTDNQKDEK